MPTIYTHAMLDMITSSMLHLRTTSLLDLIVMIAYYDASPMIHSCSFHWVDDVYLHVTHIIYLAHCQLSSLVASLILPCGECNHVMFIYLGDLDILNVTHACFIALNAFGCSSILCLHTMHYTLVLSYDKNVENTCWLFRHMNDRFCISASSFVFLSVCHVLLFWRIHRAVPSCDNLVM